MSYYVKFNDITSMQRQTNQTIQQWGKSLENLQESIASLANQSELQGEAMTSAKSYMTEVHGIFIQTLMRLMNEYTVSFLLYKDGYYQIDTHNHAELPEDVYKGLYSDLGKSKQRFEQQLEQLTTAKLRVAGLVNYQGTSHTKTKFTYEKLMKDIKHLDESITQYEEMHARQDLQTFKELLAATKSLLAEHSSRDRSMGSYQIEDFRQLPSMNRFMLAVQQSAIYLNNHMPQFQAAQEREKVRVYAEERTKQGAMELVFGVLTFVVGGSALFMSGGTMWPIVTFAFKSGALAFSLSGFSKSIEAVQNIYYGLSGDGKSVAVNPIRDTMFIGKEELYHSLEQIFGLTTGVFIPIAKTKSIVQGLWQFTWGTIGGLATGQAAYHGTKLLGGSEETAQMMNLFGNLVGAYYAAKAVENFSLNGKTAPKVESALEIKNRVIENIKASKAARESSKFDNYLRQEYAQQGKYFAERIIWKNGKYAYLSNDIDRATGKPTPVRYRSYLKDDGSINWPPKDGFVLDEMGNPITESANLKAGQVFDRFGNAFGNFVSPVENGEKLTYNARGLPYPEDYKPYHQYKIVQDLTKDNIINAFNESSIELKEFIKEQLATNEQTLNDLSDIIKGPISRAFGQGGGEQIRFRTSIDIYEKLKLIEEIIE